MMRPPVDISKLFPEDLERDAARGAADLDELQRLHVAAEAAKDKLARLRENTPAAQSAEAALRHLERDHAAEVEHLSANVRYWDLAHSIANRAYHPETGERVFSDADVAQRLRNREVALRAINSRNQKTAERRKAIEERYPR